MISIIYANLHIRSGPNGRVELGWVEGKLLKMYLKEARLSGLRRHCRIDVVGEGVMPVKVRGSYVPRDGDVIKLRRVGGGV